MCSLVSPLTHPIHNRIFDSVREKRGKSVIDLKGKREKEKKKKENGREKRERKEEKHTKERGPWRTKDSSELNWDLAPGIALSRRIYDAVRDKRTGRSVNVPLLLPARVQGRREIESYHG